MGPILRFLKRLAAPERRATRPRHSTHGTSPYHRRLIAEPLEQRQLLAVGLGLGAPPLAGHSQTLADLPGAAQQAISSAIGQDQLAYHIESAAAGASLANRANGFTAQLQAGMLQVSTGLNNWDMSLVDSATAGRCSR